MGNASTVSMPLSIDTLNGLNSDDAKAAFETCCTSTKWIEAMTSHRPYETVEQVQSAAQRHWQACEEADWLQAFEGHPKIGDVTSLRAKYANTKGLASNEQSGVNEASDDVLHALADGNAQYEQQNGFIFIVFATGKSAAEMLEILNGRLQNDREAELVNAAAQQAKITELRINKLFGLA